MPTFLATNPELVVPTASSWQTLDLSSYMTVGDSPAGVLVLVTNKASATYTVGLRADGSTTGGGWYLRPYQRMYYWTSISTAKKIQLYSTNVVDVDFHLLGWLSTAEAYFPVNAYTTTVTNTAAAYTDINPSSIIQSGDTPMGFFVAAKNGTSGGGTEVVGVRPNGSTDTFLQRLRLPASQVFAVATNDNLFEVRYADLTLGSPGTLTLHVTGYLKTAARVVRVINAQVIQAITEGAGWTTVPNDKTLNGQRVEDILSQLAILTSTWSDPGETLAALAGTSTDTPLSWQYRPDASSSFLSVGRGFAHWPLLRSRRTDKAQVVIMASTEFVSTDYTLSHLYAYLAFKPRTQAGMVALGALF